MVELKRPSGYPGIVPRALALMRDDDVLVCFQRDAIEECSRAAAAIRTVQHVGLRRLDPPRRRRAGRSASGTTA